MFGLCQTGSECVSLRNPAVHGYLMTVRYPNQIAANGLSAAEADLISHGTIELTSPPFAIALINLVAVCLIFYRTRVGETCQEIGSPVVAQRLLCLSLKHVTACSGNGYRISD